MRPVSHIILSQKVLILSVSFLALGACSSLGKGGKADSTLVSESGKANNSKPLALLKPSKSSDASIGVNGFLWRATLDTISFMPIASADPFGGTLVTDWHASPEKPDERFKIQVFILDTRLRADGIAVQVFRQINQGGQWVDADTDADTSVQVENAILTRARQLRIATLDSK